MTVIEAPMPHRLATPPDLESFAVIAEQARQTAVDRYGLVGDLDRLSGEKDANFRLRRANELPLLVKIVSAEEDVDVVNMHTMALLHVEATDPSLPVQRVVRALDGSPDVRVTMPDGVVRVMRVVTYVVGTLQRNAPESAAQRRNAGRMLGRLQLALRDFHHPADAHPLAWDLKRAAALKPVAAKIADGPARAKLETAIAQFEDEVISRVDSLAQQVVHNDLNSDNIVVDPTEPERVAGIIDFGDMVRTARVFDVAIGGAYQMTEAEEPYEAAFDFIAGVHDVNRLAEEEIAVLVPALVARMAQRIIMSEARASRHPENREYILRNTPRTWQQLERLVEIPRDSAEARLRAALKKDIV
jgi:Ser/Thr protein kinase RdoA (MazF antagonist)